MTYAAVRNIHTTADILNTVNSLAARPAIDSSLLKTKVKSALVTIFDSSHDNPYDLPEDIRCKMYLV